MSPECLIVAAVLLPLISAALVVACHQRPNLRETVTLVSGGLLLAIVGRLTGSVDARPAINLVDVIPGSIDQAAIAIGFHAEPLGLLFALVASGLWIATSVYSIGYMRSHGEQHQTRFFCCFAVAIGAVMGIAFARNLLTLFLFYEVLTLSTYPLVTHHGSEAAKRAGRTYLGILMGTSIVGLLLAILWTWQLAGTLEFKAGGILDGHVDPLTAGLLLALFAFGTGKAALMPLHRWLPAAMVAPTPVSALLHAVAVVKAGVFTILKVGVYIFGIDLLGRGGSSVWLMYVAAATLLSASLVALTRDNLKERLAYSTISQLAYIVLGMSLATKSSVIGGGMHIVMHACGKITLFFCAGAILVGAHKTRVSQLDGLGRKMPWTFAAFTIAALSVIGLPPMGGCWSKWLLALGTVEMGQWPLLAVLMISSLLNVAYLMPIPLRAFFREPPETDDESPGTGEAPLACVIPLCLTAAGCVVLFFCADPIYQFLSSITWK
ncbi:MAG: cation:proton antiporter [Planctomycetaceae bacterium]|jgi:multicomponent Na+:H+ antiporter subunit D|nr:cation:proton antiporter [Planctomycetaceae bacterium]MDP7275520.1 monovalent cation/H+ antiporter subunit D family protein [Planctomycetaceae bacterium]